jgi:hypothetical protein
MKQECRTKAKQIKKNNNKIKKETTTSQTFPNLRACLSRAKSRSDARTGQYKMTMKMGDRN